MKLDIVERWLAMLRVGMRWFHGGEAERLRGKITHLDIGAGFEDGIFADHGVEYNVIMQRE